MTTRAQVQDFWVIPWKTAASCGIQAILDKMAVAQSALTPPVLFLPPSLLQLCVQLQLKLQLVDAISRESFSFADYFQKTLISSTLLLCRVASAHCYRAAAWLMLGLQGSICNSSRQKQLGQQADKRAVGLGSTANHQHATQLVSLLPVQNLGWHRRPMQRQH